MEGRNNKISHDIYDPHSGHIRSYMYIDENRLHKTPDSYLALDFLTFASIFRSIQVKFDDIYLQDSTPKV